VNNTLAIGAVVATAMQAGTSLLLTAPGEMARFYEGRYVAGLAAAELTQSNIIGYIGSFPIPEVVRGINAFTLALRKANPDATVVVPVGEQLDDEALLGMNDCVEGVQGTLPK
jgi:hypothetical protein